MEGKTKEKMKDDKFGKINIFTIPLECVWLFTKGICATFFNLISPLVFIMDKIDGRKWSKLRFISLGGKSEKNGILTYKNFYNSIGYKIGYCKITKRKMLEPKEITFYDRYGKAIGECEYSKDMDCYRIFIKFKNFNDKRGKI